MDFSKKMPYKNLSLNETIKSLQARVAPDVNDIHMLLYYLKELENLRRFEYAVTSAREFLKR
jgi:hypothetical protein